MVIWMEGRRGGEAEEAVGGRGRDRQRVGRRAAVSREGGPNKSVTVGMKTHSRCTFPEVSAIR